MRDSSVEVNEGGANSSAASAHRNKRAHNLRALVIDDEPQVRNLLMDVLRAAGWRISEAETAERAFEQLREHRWTLVFCDVVLGGADGFAVLRRFRREQPEAKVILMTGHGSALGALDAVALGAYDYLLKPFTIEEIGALAEQVRSSFESRRKQRQGAGDKQVVVTHSSDIDLIGSSPAFVEVMKLVGRVAPTNLPVLIKGESGTGKEVVARAIHKRSRRADKPFIAVNCGAIPGALIESELFGHVRGAFTGAERDRAGLWEEADGGTVFLDEITETAPVFQVKLLRALQEGEIRRVGSNRTARVDVRVIAASNRDAEDEVEAGRFRQDLLYRLNAVTIRLPPLRERKEDIMPLVEYFARLVSTNAGHAVALSPDALKLMQQYSWPGNVRELENVVRRAVTFADHIVQPYDLPKYIQEAGEESPASPDMRTSEGSDARPILVVEDWITMAQLEAEYLTCVLLSTRGNRQAAARLLNVDRKTIDRMIKRHKIELMKTDGTTRDHTQTST